MTAGSVEAPTLFPVELPEPASSRPEGPVVRVRLLVAYDGRAFHGFAAQPGIRTVSGVLAESLGRVTRQHTTPVLVCAGRTDAGVHGWGQVVHADLVCEDGAPDLARVQRSLNKLLAPEVVIRQADSAPEGFDARFSASWRRYRYTISNRPTPDPFTAANAWHVPEPLALPGMRLASDPLLGEHDFSSFCRAVKARDGAEHSLVRTVLDARWVTLEDAMLRFEITAAGFCHQMVRSIVGLLVDVGRGRRRPGEVLAVLRARDRSGAGTVAPPHGLCLWEVGYAPGLGFGDGFGEGGPAATTPVVPARDDAPEITTS